MTIYEQSLILHYLDVLELCLELKDLLTVMKSFFEVAYGLILSFLAVSIISSNSFCIFVLRRAQFVNDAPKILMISLATADILTGLIGVTQVMWISLFVDGQVESEFSSDVVCRMIAVLMKSIQIVKLYSLLALNYDRYVAVMKALRYHTIMTYKKTFTVTQLMWIFSLITSIVSGYDLDWDVDVEELNLCIFTLKFESATVWLEIIFLSIMPFVMTVLIYVRLAALARQHAAQIAVLEAGLPNQHNIQHKKKAAAKAIKTFRIMTFVFAMSWVPLFVTSFIAAQVKISYNLEWIVRCSLLISFSSGFCNMLVYFRREKEILNAAKVLLNPKLESCRQFLAHALAKLQQFCCFVCGAFRHSPPTQTDDIPVDSACDVRLSRGQNEVQVQPTTPHVQRNELELQSFLGTSEEELSPHIKDSPL